MKFIQLEAKKMTLKPYLFSALGITLGALAMQYLLVMVTFIEPQATASDPMLQSYSFFYLISTLVNVIGFSCLCATMLGKYVMEAYSGKNAYLTLSYPVQRQKILRSKMGLCFLFCSLGVVLSLLVSNLIFFGLESIFSLVADQLDFTTFLQQWPMLFVAPLLVMSVGVISLQLGWLKNSLPLIIFSAVLLCSFLSNLVTLGNTQVFFIAAVLFSVIALLVLQLLKRKVVRLEL